MERWAACLSAKDIRRDRKWDIKILTSPKTVCFWSPVGPGLSDQIFAKPF